ncbi:MAG: UvrD-helicase domain-containing protein [Dehalococcoidia bacterium]
MTQARDALIDGLNPAQREAVEHVDGPLLIVAGPGSGKTRVITHRIAYLVKHVGVSPGRIAAVTFTNRAAREMKTRLERLLGSRAQALTAGTFHSLCARILRADGEAIGIQKDFVIMDDDDQLGLVKRAMEMAEVDPKRFPPRSILNAISSAKSQLRTPEGFAAGSSNYYDEIVQRIYARYQNLLSRSHGVDFDDLLAKTVELFRRSPEVLAKYQNRYVHLMVDEFQDTNTAQYEIARELAGKYSNLAVVGDPDQSIYSWRNADIRNILSFQKDYPNAKVVHLNENYRSTANILQAARQVISSNKKRLEQELFTQNESGDRVYVAEAYTEEEEAQAVLQEVDRLTRDGDFSLRDIVVTYRVNAQSRALEEACLRYGVPYKLVGGVRFYQRKEVKDVIAYLRMLQDPYDEVSLVRVINVPTRGIGKRTVDDLIAWANSLGVPAYVALQLLVGDAPGETPQAEGEYSGLSGALSAPAVPSPFSDRQKRQLVDFLRMINSLRDGMANMDLGTLIGDVLERTGYRQSLLESGDPDADDRLDNIREFRGMSSDYAGVPASESLQPFLESAALMSEQDTMAAERDQATEQQYLTLITLHQIKGLEYPVVFITGMEEGVLPHMRSMDDADQLEEERRIAYVGMTRAQKRLYLLRSFRRRLSGMPQGNPPSRFLSEIAKDLIETPNRRPSYAGASAPPGGRFGGYASQSATTAFEGDEIRAAEPPPFRAGDKVSHATFGEGIVVNCVAKPGDYEITVAFLGQSGIKRLLHSFAKLEKAEPAS